jgi:hypothetical protein
MTSSEDNPKIVIDPDQGINTTEDYAKGSDERTM